MNMGTSADPARGELTRGVGPWAAMAVNVANMIGTGVFLKARVMTCNVVQRPSYWSGLRRACCRSRVLSRIQRLRR